MQHCGNLPHQGHCFTLQTQVQLLPGPGRRSPAAAPACPIEFRNRGRAVQNQLRFLFIADRDFPLNNHCRIFRQKTAELAQRIGKHQHLHRAGIILQRHIRHHGMVPRRFHLNRLDHACHRHKLLVAERAALAGKAFQDLAQRRHFGMLQTVAVFVHRMPRQIEACRFLFKGHPVPLAQLLQPRHLHRDGCLFIAAQIKHPDLALHILALRAGYGIHDRLIDRQKLRTVQAKAVQRAALDQVLQRALVEIAAVEPLAQIFQALEASAALPLPHHQADKPAADIFHRRQAEADPFLHHGELILRLIDIRRQYGNPHTFAFGNIFRNFGRTVQHGGHQRRHILPGKMAFQIRRLIRHQRIAHGMRLIERIVCKVQDFIIDRLGGRLVDTVGNGAGNAALGVPIDKRPALLQDYGLLFFGNRAAHIVRLPQRIAAQLPENLDDLLLIYHTPVCDR